MPVLGANTFSSDDRVGGGFCASTLATWICWPASGVRKPGMSATGAAADARIATPASAIAAGPAAAAAAVAIVEPMPATALPPSEVAALAPAPTVAPVTVTPAKLATAVSEPAMVAPSAAVLVPAVSVDVPVLLDDDAGAVPSASSMRDVVVAALLKAPRGLSLPGTPLSTSFFSPSGAGVP